MMSCEELVETAQKFHYELTAAVIDGEEDMEYTTYGIVALDMEQKMVLSYPDVSTNRDFVLQIVEKCNLNNVDAMHLEDILLDSIG